MKLSDMIMLGSTTTTLNPALWYNREKACGCLIGLGIGGSGFLTSGDVCTKQVAGLWPWLTERRFAMPDNVIEYRVRFSYFGGSGFGSSYLTDTAIEIISGMARMVKEGCMTLEAAVEWIRENEPQEPEVVQPKVEEGSYAFV